MVISYDKLWKLLIDKKMNKTDLKEQAAITYNILARLGKQQPVSMESLYKICKCLHCNIGDIMEFEID
ncbi:helix-turn-helix domain-containing protein [Virgibacillus dakarensis]|uniref:Cro/Cl family transcriptional regulator n=1 Tax=Virgibacillus phasianinus TaxID=2017483 RepID=A0A220U0S6_9BACI|nr:helix-turn-helix transcriptional regulator [Virgibacillus phasianinus]ASK61595.1 Cro/Cl family transcriptional regulator [Virgibacillus phasianinus]MTW87063.1 helix-turn-helix domain-containing protein [Virgibacillus dakarensis]